VLNERHVYRADGAEWLPDEEWNQACDQRHLELAKVVRHDLEKTLRSLPFFQDMVLVQEHSAVAGIVTPDESSMELAVAALNTLRLTHPDFDFQRNAVYLRFSHRAYTKGSALARIAQALGTTRDNTLAIGDNYNDRSMLDGTVAFPACPSNAVEEICEVVRAAGGWVLMKPAGEGTAEAIFRFLRESGSCA
jgi:hydroxymethylpyrimidine pyrophosphatase-like HAD family hydrolase